jgi:hypothetical protein
MVDTTLVSVLLALITTLPVAWKWGLSVPWVAAVVVALALLSSLQMERYSPCVNRVVGSCRW